MREKKFHDKTVACFTLDQQSKAMLQSENQNLDSK